MRWQVAQPQSLRLIVPAWHRIRVVMRGADSEASVGVLSKKSVVATSALCRFCKGAVQWTL